MLASCTGEVAPPAAPAGRILWAWERPEDLSFLQPGEAKVALLVATITLRGEDVEIYGRRQPLRLPAGLVPIPVVRIETRDPALSEKQRRRLGQELARRADARAGPTLQIDFDAKESERAFYRALLDELAPGREISITALASWCDGDPWLAGAPIAEAVPMLFDMGPEGPAVLQKLQKGRDFAEPLCRRSYGVATGETYGETWPRFRPGRPLYLFSDRPWTAERFRNAASSRR